MPYYAVAQDSYVNTRVSCIIDFFYCRNDVSQLAVLCKGESPLCYLTLKRLLLKKKPTNKKKKPHVQYGFKVLPGYTITSQNIRKSLAQQKANIRAIVR